MENTTQKEQEKQKKEQEKQKKEEEKQQKKTRKGLDFLTKHAQKFNLGY